MYYCKDFASLSVLSLYEGELLGTVDRLYFDKNLKKLVELELVSDDGARLTLLSKNIYHVGKNAITVKNNQAVSIKIENNTLFSSPISSKAYSLKGEFLGVVKEMTFDEKFKTEKLILDNEKTLDLSNLASCGKNTVIFYDNNDNIDVKKFVPQKTPKLFKKFNAQIAKILPAETKQEDLVENENIVPVTKSSQKIDQASNFLIGRVCTKDIFNFNNELLVKAQTVVTKKILKEVNKYGKLRELMLYSR